MEVFVFGPLLDPALRRIVLGREVEGRPAALPGHRLERAADGSGPALVAAAGDRVEGRILSLEAEAAERLDLYEEGCGRRGEAARLRAEGEAVAARLYRRPGPGAGEPWDLARWQAERGALERRTAAGILEMAGRTELRELRFREPMIRARADAALRAARTPMPTDLRAPLHRDEVEVLRHRQPYCHYFAVGETRLRHPLYTGGASAPVERSGFHMTDAVTVLPYDPERERVLVIEQFRYGPWLRGDPYPWILEPVAGRVDPGEDAEVTARREAREEAGVEIGALHRIGSYYPSPGGVSEYLESYVGIADLPDRERRIGGLDAEDEDIRAHVIPLDRAMELVASGEVDTAPLLVSLLWLEAARNRGAFA
jgi:ADP-ribose pyrophosphatase